MITADSNIFVYMYDDRAPSKQAMAKSTVRALLNSKSCMALQVIGEVQNVLQRKFKMPNWKAAQAGHNILLSFETFPVTRTAAAWALGQLSAGRLSYWDAVLLASAGEAGCTTLLTEDMQDGATFLGVEIVNPFGEDGALSARAREILDL